MDNQNTNQNHHKSNTKLTQHNASIALNLVLIIAILYMVATPTPSIEQQVRSITELNKNTHDHLQLIKQSAEWSILKK